MKILEKLKNDRQDLISKLCDNIDALEKIALEQQAEIEKLKKIEHFADKTIEKQSAEIERLQEENRGLRKICDRALKTYKETKAEAIKEFAQTLKHLINRDLYHSGSNIVEKIDNLVKEMVGE